MEREFTMITSGQEKTDSTVNHKQFSHLVAHKHKCGNMIKTH